MGAAGRTGAGMNPARKVALFSTASLQTPPRYSSLSLSKPHRYMRASQSSPKKILVRTKVTACCLGQVPPVFIKEKNAGDPHQTKMSLRCAVQEHSYWPESLAL